MNQYKRIFVVGHIGAGKALVAKALSEELGWQFINADLGLEARIGRTLSEIVGIQGEEAFFKRGTEILIHQLNQDHIVVVTDASIFSSEKNRQLLSSQFVVYLKVSTSIQLERISTNPDPLLPINNHKEFLETLHKERDDLYEQEASLTIDTDDNDLDKHVSSIIKALGK